MSKSLLLSVLLVMSGCAFKLTGEQRSFTYQNHYGNFSCLHSPFSVEISIDKGIAKSADKRKSNKMANDKKFTPMEEAVRMCQQLIQGKPINKNG